MKKTHKMSDWHGFYSHLKQVRSGLIFLAALWLSLGVPGCISSPPNSQTALSSGPTQTATATTQRFDGATINVITQKGVFDVALGRHIGNFESLTGAKIDMVAFPFKTIEKIQKL